MSSISAFFILHPSCVKTCVLFERQDGKVSNEFTDNLSLNTRLINRDRVTRAVKPGVEFFYFSLK